ncbi:MAG: hypothetical protein R6U19_09485 [Bacteroidales bacterium]
MSIGGYFELELPYEDEYHKNAIHLNTGRNAFEYILRAKGYKKVYLPYYTCNVMLEPIHKLNIKHEFYHIDQTFRPVFDPGKILHDEAFVFNNYFGICDKQVKEITGKYKNLIVDNSQAFYSRPISGVDTFYSPRKFFGLPDGAYLYTDTPLNLDLDQDVSFERCSHLLGRIDTGAEKHYDSFKRNSLALVNQPIKQMSNLTKRLLQSINYENIAQIRKNNFRFLDHALRNKNELTITVNEDMVPMVYPFLRSNGNALKKKFIESNIFVATYWPNVLKWCSDSSKEYHLALNLLNIPVDQRYDSEHIYNRSFNILRQE